MIVEKAGVKHLRVGTMKVEVHPSSAAAGRAAANVFAKAIERLEATEKSVGAIFATGASQLYMLDALTALPNIPWNKIQGVHLDEYVGLSVEHRASFRHYLRERLTQKVAMNRFFEIDGEAPDTDETCRTYAQAIEAVNPQICLLGIGENGHLAFNDPGVANFADPVAVKVVELDTMCRDQQFAEGWFKTVGEVPAKAITLTIPTILRVPKLIVSVPGARKAEIMRRTLEEPISTDCPATVLRQHPDVTVYLDADSARYLDGALTPQ